MPVGRRKNRIYGLALPPVWEGGADGAPFRALRRGRRRHERGACARALHRHHVVGGCIRRMENGRLCEGYAFGHARLKPDVPVTDATYFRTASIAKMGVRTAGDAASDARQAGCGGGYRRAVGERRSATPHFPDTPIPLRAFA